jgi:hypothetical protein
VVERYVREPSAEGFRAVAVLCSEFWSGLPTWFGLFESELVYLAMSHGFD